MYILSYDTSFSYSSISIDKLENSKIINIESCMFNGEGQQATIFVKNIDRILTKNNIEYQEIQYLIINKGPGNFTSMRIAASVTKALLVAFPNIKIFCLDSLYALLLQVVKDKYQENTKYFSGQKILTIIKKNQLESYISIFNENFERIEDIKLLADIDINKLEFSDKFSLIILKNNRFIGEYKKLLKHIFLQSIFYVDNIIAKNFYYIFLQNKEAFLSNKHFKLIY